MSDKDNMAARSDQAMREALAWVSRLTSGAVTQADVAALEKWRAADVAHRTAFAEVNAAWDALGPAAATVRRRGVPAVRQDNAPPEAKRAVSRRMLIGGGLATAAAASIAVGLVKPPLSLWPSLAELSSDHRTGTGEQRRIAPFSGVMVELNTRTSLAVHNAGASGDEIELVAGEAAVATTEQALVVRARDGRALARNAKFNIRCGSDSVVVTCLAGEVAVEQAEAVRTLAAGKQVAFGPNGLGAVVAVDAAIVTAWQQGLLVFRQEPLAAVVEEINRYRTGRIVIMNEELGRRPVVGTFRIDRLDGVAERLARVFGGRVRTLPGGITLLS